MKKIILLLLICISAICTNSFATEVSSETIRVCVAKEVKSLTLSIPYSYEVRAIHSDKVLQRGKDLKDAKVIPTKHGVKIGWKYFDVFGVDIVPLDFSLSETKVNKRRYREIIRILKVSKNKISAINIIDLEHYLYGVLYNEISHEWPIEAIKAQAICSRTFAIYKKSISEKLDYDVTSDIYSQVYGGLYSERPSILTAVDETKGKILTYDGTFFPSFFHATCGGQTEDAAQLWNIDIPPLKGVLCPYCEHSPHYSWDLTLTYKELEMKLVKNGFDIGKILNIKVDGINKSGRVVKLTLTDDIGEMNMTGKDFRQKLSPNYIRSLLFDIVALPTGIRLQGKGWGHGVGMCQWGAFGMAKEGYTVEEILAYYFPESSIQQDN